MGSLGSTVHRNIRPEIDLCASGQGGLRSCQRRHAQSINLLDSSRQVTVDENCLLPCFPTPVNRDPLESTSPSGRAILYGLGYKSRTRARGLSLRPASDNVSSLGLSVLRATGVSRLPKSQFQGPGPELRGEEGRAATLALHWMQRLPSRESLLPKREKQTQPRCSDFFFVERRIRG